MIPAVQEFRRCLSPRRPSVVCPRSSYGKTYTEGSDPNTLQLCHTSLLQRFHGVCPHWFTTSQRPPFRPPILRILPTALSCARFFFPHFYPHFLPHFSSPHQLDTIGIPHTSPRYTFSTNFVNSARMRAASASSPCMTAYSSSASSRLISSIVSSLCGIAIRTPSYCVTEPFEFISTVLATGKQHLIVGQQANQEPLSCFSIGYHSS